MASQTVNLDGDLFWEAYKIDDHSYDLGMIFMTICFERAENLEEQIKDQAEEMKKRNKMLEAYSKILAECKSVSKDDDVDINNCKVIDPETGKEITGKEFLEKYGPWPIPGDAGNDGIWSQQTREAAVAQIQAKMDSLNSDSQLDMTRLQGLMGKRDNVYQMVSNLIKTDQRSKTNAITNLK